MQILPFNSQAGFQSFSGNLVDQDNTSTLNFNNRTISNGWISNDEFTVIGDLNAQHTNISCNITGSALSITNLGTGASIDANGNILSQKIFYANTSDTTEGGFREKSTAPGFWLEETGTKGAYAVLNSGSFQIQRRAENWGGYEASLMSIDLATAGMTVFGGITSNSYLVANGTGTSRIFRNSGGTVNGNITFDWADQYPQMVFRSGSTGRASILCDASLGHLYVDVSTGRNLYIRNGISGTTFLTANTAGITSTAPLFAPASTTSRTSLRIPHGSTPTIPTNGDIWSTTSGLYARVNSTTYNLTNISAANQDLSPYTLLTTTSDISANLQSQISSMSGGSGTPLTVSFGATTVSDVTTLNFVGVANLTNPVAGTATVTISGGSGGGGDPTVTSLTSQTFSPDGLSDVYDYTISSSSTVTLNAPTSIVNGKSIIFKFTQPSGGNAPLTLANGSGFTWKTPNGTLTLTTDTGNAVDIITVLRIGTNLYASIVKNLS